jgi:hypothetical protein
MALVIVSDGLIVVPLAEINPCCKFSVDFRNLWAPKLRLLAEVAVLINGLLTG